MYKREYLKMATKLTLVLSSIKVSHAQFCRLFKYEENPCVVIAILSPSKSQVLDIFDMSWSYFVTKNYRLSATGKSLLAHYLGSIEYCIDVSVVNKPE